jgi:hypothetical protein
VCGRSPLLALLVKTSPPPIRARVFRLLILLHKQLYFGIYSFLSSDPFHFVLDQTWRHGHVSIGSKNCVFDYVVTCKHGLVRKDIGTGALFKPFFFKFWVDPEPAFYLSTDPDPGSLNNGDHPDPDPVQTWLSLKSLIFFT